MIDPTQFAAELFNYILPYLPARYAADVLSLATILVALCAIVARHWPRPADGSKWLPLYRVVNALGQNAKHATNAADLLTKDKQS
ncbi:MAG: hypothetical protein ABF968_04755 [Acetobacter sp.]|uniref:hypothetical protein n=1 Tax=Acetobacter sp. TaxID=440 RepID=UPI0039ED2DBE